MDRRDFFFRQKVTEAELDGAFDAAEIADRNMTLDQGLQGVFNGLAVSEKSGTPNLTVDVAAGVAADQLGQRISVPGTQNVNVAVDYNGVSTSVGTPGNEKWVAVFLQFDRALSDPRTDGNNLSVNFVRAESFKFKVMQGAEATIGVATRPALQPDGILIADVRRTNGQTSILNADVSGASGSGLFGTTRRQDAIVVAGTPFALRAGRPAAAFAAILARYNAHVTGAQDNLAAASVNYAGGAAWLDGTTNPAATAEAQLDKMIADLKALSSGQSGADKIGQGGVVGASGTIPAGSVQSALTALKSAINIEYAGGAQWADGTTNPATTVEAQFDKIVTDLSTVVSSGGAARIGIGARTTWLGGRTNAGSTLAAAVDKIITDLSAVTNNDDGAERIGASRSTGGVGALTAGSVRSQLDQIGDGNVNFQGDKSFTSIFAPEYKYDSPVGLTKSMAHCALSSDSSLLSRTLYNGFKNSTTSAFNVDIPLDLPNGATVSAIGIRVQAAGATLPASLPTVKLIRVNRTSMAETTVGTGTDPSTTTGQYGALHTLQLTGLSETIDNSTNFYMMRVRTESGAGAAADTGYISPFATMTIPKVPASAA